MKIFLTANMLPGTYVLAWSFLCHTIAQKEGLPFVVNELCKFVSQTNRSQHGRSEKKAN